MADEIDRAQDREAKDLAAALAAQRLVAACTTRPDAQGFCLNPRCGEPFDASQPGRLFCGPECAQAYHRYMRQ